MKRLALVAAVFVAAACSTGEQKADTAAPAMAPAPAMSGDTGMKMDSTSAARMDSTMKRMDTTTKKP